MQTESGSGKTARRGAQQLHVIETRVAEGELAERLAGKITPLAKLVSGIPSVPAIERSELYLKPYYFSTCLQKKRFGISNFEEAEIQVSVDALTGVASVYEHQPHWDGVRRQDLPAGTTLIEPQLTADDAADKTLRKATHLQVRHKCEVRIVSEPFLVYKPIWLVTVLGRKGSKRYAVDAFTGYVLQE